MKKNNILLILLIFFSKILHSNEIEITTIVENCKGCHGYDLNGNEYISSIVKLKKEDFILKMKKYRQSNENSVMIRIVKPLNSDDIQAIANLIYKKYEKK
tara:strand:+ start:42 stop:341 length:300 start_codon:yes stop_codon:yes gene_type:complete